jgi:hypothetical protein
VAGCGGSQQGGADPASERGKVAQSAAEQDDPAAAVFAFLEAVRTGDDEKAAMMLTSAARKRTAELDLEVAPPGSDTASFEVGEVQRVGEDGARVASTWSDLGENLQRQAHDFLWMVRREPEGWRIAGVAASVFEGEPPLKLNFEDPQEMLQKQKWVQEESMRRAQQQQSRAQAPEIPERPARR